MKHAEVNSVPDRFARLVRVIPEERLVDLVPIFIPRITFVRGFFAAGGYRVVRIPIVPGHDGRTYVTYLNAILDRRGGRRMVYMPVFSGAGPLNRAAAEVWTGLGYEVRSVDCDACYPHFGSLRCLVNVLRRD